MPTTYEYDLLISIISAVVDGQKLKITCKGGFTSIFLRVPTWVGVSAITREHRPCFPANVPEVLLASRAMM